tara:strand:+ start:25 stop:285 length:261 start_codon:yes stop_codon:yes gene_type:complete
VQDLEVEIHSQEQLVPHHQMVGEMMVALEAVIQLVLVAVVLEVLVKIVALEAVHQLEELEVLEYRFPQHLEIQIQNQDHLVLLVED